MVAQAWPVLVVGGPLHGRSLRMCAWETERFVALAHEPSGPQYCFERFLYRRSRVCFQPAPGVVHRVDFLHPDGASDLDVLQEALDEEGCGPVFAAMMFQEDVR